MGQTRSTIIIQMLSKITGYICSGEAAADPTFKINKRIEGVIQRLRDGFEVTSDRGGGDQETHLISWECFFTCAMEL